VVVEGEQKERWREFGVKEETIDGVQPPVQGPQGCPD
jgi:hypothetical protein